MTVRKRLFWSNILMILVPVIATTLIGIFCVVLIVMFLYSGTGIGLNDRERFDYTSMAFVELLEKGLENGTDLSAMEKLIDGNGMKVMIMRDGRSVFHYGEEWDNDSDLMAAVDSLGADAFIVREGRSLLVHNERIEGCDYQICVFGGSASRDAESDMKILLFAAVAVIFLTILCSILLTNRFLIRFVFRKIEGPLDILIHGVHEIRDGNLDYRIEYDGQDEFLAVCEDFNEMAERLKTSVRQIQRQERSRKELIAGISHDIRSPLTSIIAYVEGLLDGIARTPEAQKNYLETIRDKAGDLNRIVSQLFLFSKMELGDYPEDPYEIRLDETIMEIVNALREEYEKKGLSIFTETEPFTLYADPIQIQRIVTNILDNSLKYKKKEQGSVQIFLRRTKNGCRLSFADDGPGVPKEALPHLFEVFYRSDPARHNPDQGSGLGLAIAAIERDYLEIDGFAVEIVPDGVTGRQEDIDKIRGLLAQYRRLSGKKRIPSEIKLGGIRINTGTHRVFSDGREIELKNKEYELLLFLMLNADMVFDRETLYERVWGIDAMGDNATVAVHINRLREKIEKNPADPQYIETVWGAGYRFRG